MRARKNAWVFALWVLAGLLGAHAATAYKPTCRSSAGAIVQCSGTLDNTQAPTAIAASSLTGTVGVSQGGTGSTSYTGSGAIVADASGTALISTAAPTTAGQYMLWDGIQWVPGLQTGSVYYFRRDASSIVGYEQITQTPQTGAEKTASTTLNNGSGTVVFDPYATNAGEPGLTQLLAGTWAFDIYAQVSSTSGGNTTNLILQVYKRTTGGTETLLFSTSSPALDSTSPKLYSWLYTQAADIPIDVTDRLVVKVAATNSSGSNRTVTFYYEGATRYSHFHPPFLSLIDAGSLVTVGGTQTITGTKTFSAPPVMSGASITDATIPNTKIVGAQLGRVLADNGTNGQWVPPGTLNYLFFSNGGSSLPAWTNTLVGINIDGATNTITNIPTSGLASGFNLPANQGGTGFTSYVVGDILAANTTSTLSKVAASTSGYLLTANGAGVLPSYQAPVTNTTDAASLSAASYSLTTNNFEDIGLSLSGVAAGKYLVVAEVRNAVSCSSGTGGYLILELYNDTAGASIANSERIGAFAATTSTTFITTTPLSEIVTLGATSTLKVRAKSPVVCTYGIRAAYSDTDGWSRIKLVKVSS